MNRRCRIVEPRIKSLVGTLNRISYITTVSSCQGHFVGYLDLPQDENLKKDEPARVTFELSNPAEKKFEKLAYLILSETSKSVLKCVVDIHKRYYAPPGSGRLLHNWDILFTPFEPVYFSPSEKRCVTDEAISTVETIVLEYFHSSP